MLKTVTPERHHTTKSMPLWAVKEVKRKGIRRTRENRTPGKNPSGGTSALHFGLSTTLQHQDISHMTPSETLNQRTWGQQQWKLNLKHHSISTEKASHKNPAPKPNEQQRSHALPTLSTPAIILVLTSGTFQTTCSKLRQNL